MALLGLSLFGEDGSASLILQKDGIWRLKHEIYGNRKVLWADGSVGLPLTQSFATMLGFAELNIVAYQLNIRNKR